MAYSFVSRVSCFEFNCVFLKYMFQCLLSFRALIVRPLLPRIIPDPRMIALCEFCTYFCLSLLLPRILRPKISSENDARIPAPDRIRRLMRGHNPPSHQTGASCTVDDISIYLISTVHIRTFSRYEYCTRTALWRSGVDQKGAATPAAHSMRPSASFCAQDICVSRALFIFSMV